MARPEWPEVPCKTCGSTIRLVKTASGWKPFDTVEFVPHRCNGGSDVYDHPGKLVPLFSPRNNRFGK